MNDRQRRAYLKKKKIIRRRRMILIGAAALILAILIGLPILIFGGRDNEEKELGDTTTTTPVQAASTPSGSEEQSTGAGPVIVIDAGHGGNTNPGHIYTGVYEKDLNLQIALKLKTVLEENGFNPVLTRTDDTYSSPQTRLELAESLGAVMLISIHQNCDESDILTSGIRTYYNETVKSANRHFANCIQSCLISLTAVPDLGTAADTSLMILKGEAMLSCQIETGYISNQSDRDLLQNEDYQYLLAQGIVDGILKFNRGE